MPNFYFVSFHSVLQDLIAMLTKCLQSGVYVTMFRQYLFAHPVIEGSEQEGWIRTAKQKINVAASQVVSSLEIVVSLDLMPYVQRET